MEESKNRIPWNGFSELKTADQLDQYVKQHSCHEKYFHYTTLGAIDSILENMTIRISSPNCFNDKKDKKQFGGSNELKKYFSLCFSTGTEENLSLWYLYSGVDGKGGRFGFTHSKLMKMIEKGNFYLAEYDNAEKKPINSTKVLLTKDDTMTISLRDVLYFKERRAKDNDKAKSVILKYNTMRNLGSVTSEELKKYQRANKGFSKNILWYYEKETRLLVELINDGIKLVENDKDYIVLWEFPEEYKKHIEIMCAPEIQNNRELNKYPNIKSLMNETSRVVFSENAGDIQMNICSKCNKSKA